MREYVLCRVDRAILTTSARSGCSRHRSKGLVILLAVHTIPPLSYRPIVVPSSPSSRSPLGIVAPRILVEQVQWDLGVVVKNRKTKSCGAGRSRIEGGGLRVVLWIFEKGKSSSGLVMLFAHLLMIETGPRTLETSPTPFEYPPWDFVAGSCR